MCALLAGGGEKVSAAPRRVKGEGTEKALAATTSGVGGTMGGATQRPILVARPVLSRKIFHPHVSRPAVRSFPFLPIRMSRCGYFVSVCRASCSNSRQVGRGATDIKSADEASLSSLSNSTFCIDPFSELRRLLLLGLIRSHRSSPTYVALKARYSYARALFMTCDVIPCFLFWIFRQQGRFYFLK